MNQAAILLVLALAVVQAFATISREPSKYPGATVFGLKANSEGTGYMIVAGTIQDCHGASECDDIVCELFSNGTQPYIVDAIGIVPNVVGKVCL